MAIRQEEIGFKAVQIFKDQILGIGSYGKVCRAKCDNLDCAAKLLHETLFDGNAEQLISHRRAHRLPLRRFEKECEFLDAIKHPNIIQYLGMYQDPSSGLAVLLMELMDTSLTSYLEASLHLQPLAIPFHLQVNICHDIALALSFLHSNGILHRDLSSNNVLLSGQPNVRAKVTDFGMASLSNQLSPRQTLSFTNTMCPGTDVYMPPEAVKEQPLYSMKIDCFSFGVILLQILTRKFPRPEDRLKKMELDGPGMSKVTAFVPVPECERRQEHISEVDPGNPLLQIALDCLKDRDSDRPSAKSLCERVVNLKGCHKYRESVARNVTVESGQFGSSRSATNASVIRELEQQARGQRQQIRNLHQTIESQAEEFDRRLVQKDETIQQKEQMLTEKNVLLEQKEREISRGERDLRLTRDQLRAVSQDKHNLEEENVTLKQHHAKTVQDLEVTIQDQADNFKNEIEKRDHTIANQREELSSKEIALLQKQQTLVERDEMIEQGKREIQQLRQQMDQEKTHRLMLENKLLKFQHQPPIRQNDIHHHHQVHHQPLPAPVKSAAKSSGQQATPLSIVWRDGWNMPCSMERGCGAVVKGTMAYFIVAGTSLVYNFNISDNTCFPLPPCPFCFSSLVVIDEMLTAIGGSQTSNSDTSVTKYCSNKLFSFTDAGNWYEKFPHMPTKRDSTASLHTRASLIVAGGRNRGGGCLNVVEVLNTETQQWSSAPNLPIPMRNMSAVICGGDLFFLGGIDRDFFGSKTVFTCPANALVKICEPKSLGARLVSSMTSSTRFWTRVADLPVTKSTCTSFCDYLLAVGGEDLDYVPSKAIHMYDPMLNSWKVVSYMSVARSNCIVALFPNSRLMVGGRASAGRNNKIEIAHIVV